MEVRVAELPAQARQGQDRVLIGDNVVVVLDGASGSDGTVSVAAYVDTLGVQLLGALERRPTAPLRTGLRTALMGVTQVLNLQPGDSPSSTVSIIRSALGHVDVLVLGDTPVYLATRSAGVLRIFDDRLAQLPVTHRPAALARLQAGGGYDDEHQRILRKMRNEKAPYQNATGGYWIAAADPAAGCEALVRSFPAEDVLWGAILTDGAEDPMRHLGISIDHVAELSEGDLGTLLSQFHNWEEREDPQGQLLPRFKCHDDKSIAVVTFR
ncbi:hypothetical protein [Frankia sp. Cppng1_Ct_nod]|uniref:hypothetical protein n=1 Tax=Frankia sp. Cppng1_Ct_nod TaxID=2897162 RepID=UPI0013EFC0D9|nr:hypothetical protein [Frankia sp. Cppng1_Ct_nod]